MNPSEEIFGALQQHMRTNQELRLINVYKGVPVSFGATVTQINLEEQTAALRVHRYQAVCIYMDQETFINSDLLPEPARAQVVDVDVAAGTAILTGFRYAVSSIGDRALVRVQFKEPLPISIITEKVTVRGTVDDISASGLAAVIDNITYNIFLPSPGREIRIRLILPFEDEPVEIEMKGIIRHITRIANNRRYKIGIQSFPNKDTERVISRYILQRQLEIIQDIKSLYETFKWYQQSQSQ
ncbi:MAG TPA: PilZ domain-containing protein [Anaerolineaceae bacterium]|nr:PilZ domain-containing protein [Anaerolineaceae bacterium]HPN52770.1 PilZ domain-containing protein [Anaerolineaceae bacterium]